MAIYKTISSQEIIRKVMRDLKPEDANWIDDAIEWIGEALEHIGASAQLESKTCILDVKDHKSALPEELYYIEQGGVSDLEQIQQLETLIQKLREEIRGHEQVYKEIGRQVADSLEQIGDGTISSNLTSTQINGLGKIRKATDFEISRMAAEAHVIYNASTDFNGQKIEILSQCTSSFNAADDCPDCNFNTSTCYFAENDHLKTSFETGKVCVAYKVFPTDVDCYPMMPYSVSYKEAMFWYIFKKMQLRGMQSPNGFDYMTANQQWQYYCTQARNEAVFPDITKLDSFMNQWVRLVPNINRVSNGFENLGSREELHRGRYNTYGT